MSFLSRQDLLKKIKLEFSKRSIQDLSWFHYI